ncbi:MAG: phosphoglucosamine mutase [Candidatus Odinarchaeia archaeon]
MPYVESRLFGTNGIRGVVNDLFTPEFSAKIGQAIGSFFGNGPILVGGDGRLSTPMIKNAVISGLVSSGVDVIDVGIAPTPAIQYATKELNVSGAVIVTASHNPPQFNGVKVIDSDGIEISHEKELKIEEIFFESNFKKAEWNSLGQLTTDTSIIERYIDAILNKIDVDVIKKKSLKIVVDPGNGVGALVTPYLLRKLGCKVVTINAQVDGSFPGRNPEPNPDNLQELMKLVKVLNADLGIAHDGDADRVIFVDEEGNFHWGDISFALIIRKLLRENKGGKIVTPVASSKLIEDIVAQNNGELIWTPVGSIIVARTLKEVNGICGGEENGGIFYAPHQYVRDGAMGAVLMLEIMCETGKKLSELVSELPKYYMTKLKVKCSNEIKQKVMEKILKKVEDYEVITLDGVKIITEKGWVIIRPSGTEPLFRCYAESSDKNASEELAKWGITLIKEAINSL